MFQFHVFDKSLYYYMVNKMLALTLHLNNCSAFPVFINMHRICIFFVTGSLLRWYGSSSPSIRCCYNSLQSSWLDPYERSWTHWSTCWTHRYWNHSMENIYEVKIHFYIILVSKEFFQPFFLMEIIVCTTSCFHTMFLVRPRFNSQST